MKYLQFEEENGIGQLTINRPEALNALNLGLLEEFKRFLEEDMRAIALRVLIVTGAGDKAFIAGADIKEMQKLGSLGIDAFIALGQEVTCLLENAEMITIAAVNGFALGGGLEIALSCDFIYASETAKLGLPEVSLGIIPGFGGTQRLARAAGVRRAKEMITTGKSIEAEEAKAIGIVNHVCKPSALLGACWSAAGRIAKHSQIAVRQAKNAIDKGLEMPLSEALEWEHSCFSLCFDTKEREEAMRQFENRSRSKENVR